MAVQELLVRLGLDSSSFSKQIKGVEKELSILDKEFDAVSSATKNFGKTQEDLAVKSQYLEKKIEGLKDVSDLLVKSYDETTAKIEDAKSRVAEFSESLERSKKAHDSTKEALAKYTLELDQAQNKFNTTDNNLKVLNQTYSEQAKELEKNEKELSIHQQAMKETAERIAEVEKAYKDQQRELNNNTQNLKNNSAKKEALIKTEGELKNKLEQLNNEYAEHQKRIDQCNLKIAENTQKYGEGSKNVQNWKQKLEEATNKQKAVSEGIEKTNQALEKNASDLQKVSAKVETYRDKVEKLQASQEKYKDELSKLKPELDKLTKEEEQLKDARDKQKKTVDNLKESLDKLQKKHKEEKEALEQANTNYKNASKNLEEIEKDIKSYSQQLDKATRELANHNKTLQETQAKMGTVAKEYNQMTMAMRDNQIAQAQLNMRNYAESLEKTGNVLTSVGSAMQNVGNTLTFGLSMPIATFGATAGKTFLEFEERIRKVNAVFGGASEGMAQQYNYLSERARYYGSTTEWTSVQVGEAYEYMAMAGWTVEESTEAMSSMLNLASIGMLDLGTTTDILTDTMTPFSSYLDKVREQTEAMGKEFNASQYMVDIFAQTIRRSNTNVELLGETMKYSASVTAEAGASFEDMATAVGIMANSGIKGSMAGTSLAQGITRLLAPTDNAIGVMQEFGISVAKNSDGGMDLAGTIENLREGFSKMDKDVQVANAKVIFGQTALKGWLPLIRGSAEEFNELSDAIRNSAGASDEMMKEIQKSGAYQFKMMTSAISEFLIVVGEALAPAMESIAKTITEVANKLSSWVTKMKETNPEMLSMIGKFGLMAVVIPPVISVIGAMTSGMGSLYSGVGKTITSLLNYQRTNMEVANGTRSTISATSLLSKGIGHLVTTFGAVPVAIGAVVVALTGIATAVGNSEKALSSLMDKFGALGTFIAGICEFVSGVVNGTFGQLINLLVGVGKVIGKIVTMKWNEIDDVLVEMGNKMKITNKKAWDNIKLDTTRALSELKNMTSEETQGIVDVFDKTLKGLEGVTYDNVGEVSKVFAEQFNDLDANTIKVVSGLSDQMGLIFDKIKEDMSIEDMEKQFTDNLKTMVKSGELNLSELEQEFADAKEMMSTHMKDGANKIEKHTREIVGSLGEISQKGIDTVTTNIANSLSKMDVETFNGLKAVGGTWSELFKGIEDNTSLTLDQIKEIITKNIDEIGANTPEGLKKLSEEIDNTFEFAEEQVNISMDAISDKVQGETEEVTGSFQTMLDTIKNGSDAGISDIANIFAEGLSGLSAESIETLRTTSDFWYAILDETTTESGGLVDNFAQQIMWNLGWVAQQSPEKIGSFKEGLIQGLKDANILSEDEMSILVGIIEGKTDEMVGASKETGEDVKENLIPTGVSEDMGEELEGLKGTFAQKSKELLGDSVGIGTEISDNVTPTGTSEKVAEELEAIRGTFAMKSQELSEQSAKVGEEAQKSFDEKVSQMGKDIEIDENIINVEALGVQFQNAGTLAIQNFVMGWSNNIGLITEAIQLSLNNIGDMSVPLEALNLQLDNFIQKSALLDEVATNLKAKVDNLNSTALTNLLNNVDKVRNKILESITSTVQLKNEMTSLSKQGMSYLNSEINLANTNIKTLKNSIKDTSKEVKTLSNKKLTDLGKQFTDAKDKSKSAKDEVEKLTTKVKDLNSTSLNGIIGRVNNLNSALSTGSSRADNFRNKLQQLNNVSFNNLINSLARVNNWLGSVRTSANNTAYAVGNVSTQRPRSIEENPITIMTSDYFAEAYGRSEFDVSKYKTTGGYYTPKSMAGTGSQARQMSSQKEQLNILEQQNELLKQLLIAMNSNNGVSVSVELDGRQVAKSTAKYMEKEIATINKRKERLGGNF